MSSFLKRIKRIVTAEGGKRIQGSSGTGTRSTAAEDSDAIFSLSSAHVAMETKLGLASTGRSAICLKSVSGMQFEEAKNEVAGFLEISRSDSGLRYRMTTDSYGYLWIILEGEKIEDLLAAAIAVGDTLEERGFSAQLLACVFEFEGRGTAAAPAAARGTDAAPPGRNKSEKSRQYLIYNYRRNSFYPFVPLASGSGGSNKKARDTESEMKMMAALSGEAAVPFERDMALWYPLWDLPL